MKKVDSKVVDSMQVLEFELRELTCLLVRDFSIFPYPERVLYQLSATLNSYETLRDTLFVEEPKKD